MSLFILGVLTGWLAEWIFYNFYWKSHDEKSTVKTECEAVSSNEIGFDDSKDAVKTSAETAETVIPKIKPSNKKDNLARLSGIGPSMLKRLREEKIDTFKQLSETNIEDLKEKLIANGARINNKEIMLSWNEQAKLAEAGNFDALETLQKKLKKS